MREAARLFRAKGFDGTSTRELAAAAGVQSASLYHYMSGKEDLLHDICMQGNAMMIAAVSEAVRNSESPLESVEIAIRAHLRTAIENRDVYLTTLSEIRSLSPSRQRAIRAKREEYGALLEKLFLAAQESGDIRSDISARHLSLLMRNLLAWTLVWFHADGELSIDEIAGLMIKVFFEGTLAKGARIVPLPGVVALDSGPSAGA